MSIVKPRLLDVRSAARMLGMSPGALRARIWQGQIPIVRIGRRVFLDRNQMERWIAENSEPQTPQLRP
jgi:hypothetical protein